MMDLRKIMAGQTTYQPPINQLGLCLKAMHADKMLIKAIENLDGYSGDTLSIHRDVIRDSVWDYARAYGVDEAKVWANFKPLANF